MVGQIKVLGHGKTSSMIAGIMIISHRRPKVLTKTVRKFTAGFSNVQHVTSLAKDRIDHDGGSTIEPPFEVNTDFRPWKLSYQSSPCSYKCDTWVAYHALHVNVSHNTFFSSRSEQQQQQQLYLHLHYMKFRLSNKNKYDKVHGCPK